MKGRYAFGNVQDALYRRLDAIRKAWLGRGDGRDPHPEERDVLPLARLAVTSKMQSILRRSSRSASLTPTVSHWLPTREYRIVSDYVAAGGEIPENLNIRFSAHMIGGVVPTLPEAQGPGHRLDGDAGRLDRRPRLPCSKAGQRVRRLQGLLDTKCPTGQLQAPLGGASCSERTRSALLSTAATAGTAAIPS